MMKKGVLISVSMFILYLIWRYLYSSLFKYFLVKEEFITISGYWLDLVETLFYMISICAIIFYLKNRQLTKNNIESFNIGFPIVLVIFLAVIYRIAEDPILRYSQIFGANFNLFSIYSNYSNIERLVSGLNVILLAPILEELIFRKGMLDLFCRKNLGISILLSSIFFAAIHANGVVSNYTTIFASFLFGVVTCIVYIRFNIIVSIVFHVMYNLVWYILEIRKADYWKIISELDFNHTYWFTHLASAATISLAIYGMIRKKE